jgi:succinoglycan biosynthesis transport protein ExoP
MSDLVVSASVPRHGGGLMLNRTEAFHDQGRRFPQEGARHGDEFLDLDHILAACRRQWPIAALTTAILTALGFAIVFMASPLYTASTDVLIDHNSGKIASELTLLGEAIESEVSILSQVEIIKSEKVAGSVADALGLVDDPAFAAPGAGLLSSLKSFVLGQQDPAADADGSDMARRAVVEALRQNLGVARIGQTYVLQLSYTSPTPDLSVRIADAYAAAYLEDQLESKLVVNQQAATWLEGRIDELRAKVLAADLAVQTFSTENGLITTGGALVSDQLLAELNTLMVQAKAETAKSQARYDRIRAIMAMDRTDAVVTDALDSDVISGLRRSYMDASKRESEIRESLGPGHEQAVRLRGEMEQYRRLMFEELGRISESYRSDLEMAQSREQALRGQVDSATGVSKLASTTQVQLRELQREADTYRGLYQKVLQRYQETTQQQSFPVTEARIISRALPPDKPSFPRKSLIIALAAVIGATLGAAIGAVREFRDGTVRTGDDVREMLGVEFLGYLADKSGDAGWKPAAQLEQNAIRPYGPGIPLLNLEAMRAARIAIDQASGTAKSRVVGVVSALPREGKSTVSLHLARALAAQGLRTLLIDGDLRSRTLSRRLAPKATAGLDDLINGSADLASAIVPLQGTGLSFLPVSSRDITAGLGETLSAPLVSAILNEASADFDYLVVDLPPIMPVADVRAIVPAIDSVLLVIAWGKTTRKAVASALLVEPSVHEKCVGAILNRVDRRKLALYERPTTREAFLAFRSGERRELDERG